ncbi:MurR/RpiR family transcriptional regulator [Companilactobacillus sp. RD055328]|uniref:MurR/RpiR family transcriptional regulator n=1 Tax=Companilactobacillus sp. RD055328 TaxID=2916634 RepID=UPI001FC81CCB|nr:MurR/RpiR family transcriptional regulator [Companilactobacillus sp. RD055328]GKQ42317.1 MurR/RpiR family transcriptional regulator [Companilactobacillus sp. RD055328]
MKLEELINIHYKDFSETDTYIYSFLNAHKKEMDSYSIKEFAKKSLSSKSSVIRFSQKLGFTGFSELKSFVKWEQEKKNQVNFNYSFQKQVIEDASETIEYLRNKNFLKVYEKLDDANNIYIFSTGTTQRMQAKEFQRLLMLIGIDSRIVHGNVKIAEFKRMHEMMTDKDMAFILSLSGESIDLEEVVSAIKRKRSSLISITNYKNNWLSENCDYNLYAVSSRSSMSDDWWIRTTSTFFVLIENFIFGYKDYLIKNKKRK